MGGKVWSEREEFIFWVLLAIFFPPGLHQETKSVKKGRSDILKSWESLPERMVETWRKEYPGEEPPRKYTAVSMYEHYFQNFVQGKLSPNAKPFVEKYKAWLKKKAENPESGSDNEESESRELSMDSESRESSEPESSKAKESEPSETAISIPTSAISHQGTGQQIACEAPVPSKCHPATEPWEKYWQGRWPNKQVSHDHGSQERLGKRHRVMDSGHGEINMSAPKALPNQHDTHAEQNANGGGQCVGAPLAQMVFQNQNRMPLQQNTNGGDQFAGVPPAHMGLQNQNRMPAQQITGGNGQSFILPAHMSIQNHNGTNQASVNRNFSHSVQQNISRGGQSRPVMPNTHGPLHNNWGQVNGGADYAGLITGDHGAQNNANLFAGHNATQVNYRGVTGPGHVHNNTNSFMDHGAAQSNHNTTTGRGDAQKRKRSDL